MGHWFGAAIVGLHWSPTTFWEATLAEFFMAVDGHKETQRPKGPAPMTRAEFEELEARYLGH